MPKYSVVVPFHNEEDNVTALYDQLKAVMEQVGESFELVLVDDGSSDRSYKLLEEIAAVDSRVLVVKLRRNFGQTSALAAGFDHAQGEYILAMDGDLQHDPAEIPGFLEKLEEGYDVVSGWRKERVDNAIMRKFPSRCANWLMARLSGVNIHDFGTTFKAYRREVIHNIPLYGEMHRFIPALASWYGASICEIPIKNVVRERGKSHYGISRTFRVFFDLLTIRFLLKYMSRPLHFFGSIGALSMFAGGGISIFLMLREVLYHAGRDGPAWAADRDGRHPPPGRHSDAGDRAAGRVAGAAFPHPATAGSLCDRPAGAAAQSGRAEHVAGRVALPLELIRLTGAPTVSRFCFLRFNLYSPNGIVLFAFLQSRQTKDLRVGSRARANVVRWRFRAKSQAGVPPSLVFPVFFLVFSDLRCWFRDKFFVF